MGVASAPGRQSVLRNMHIEFPTGPLARGKHTSGVFSMVEVKNMSYRQQRDYENLNKAIFDGVGKYDIPVIEPDSPQVDNWISFNYAKGKHGD